MRILIADDDPVARLVLKNTLTQFGHEVIEAENGAQAWTRYRDHDVRVLIIDWMMPELDGLELSRMVRSERRSTYVYIIMLTILEGKGSYLQTMDAGADDFISKPIDPDELAARLRVAQRILGLQAEVCQLEGLLRICTYCKKIRDHEDNWYDLDRYIAQHTDTSFSHGICPSCYDSQVTKELERLEQLGAP